MKLHKKGFPFYDFDMEPQKFWRITTEIGICLKKQLSEIPSIFYN